MTQAQQTLLQILQNSLFQTNHGIPADTDWNAVLREAEEQAVLGLAIDAAPEDVRRAVFENLDIAGEHGGLFACPTHLLEPEVPVENVVAYIQACVDYCK